MTTTPTASPELLDLETLRKIGILITTQDNRITDQPMFIVQQRRRMYGLDTGYCDNFIWLCCEDEYNEASAEEADALEAEYQDTGRARDGWQRTGYIDQWEFVTACFTEQGCIDYLKLDGHNLNEPRIYAEGSYRNEEFRAVRNSLIALARRAQPEGEAPQAEFVPFAHFITVNNHDGSATTITTRANDPDGFVLYKPSGTLSPLCGAQQNAELVVARLEQIVEGCDNASERAEEALVCMRAVLGAQHAESGKEAQCTIGVGDGSGRLFVHGDYDSIMAVRSIIIENEYLRAAQHAAAPGAGGRPLDPEATRAIRRAVRYLEENDCTGPAADLNALLDTPAATSAPGTPEAPSQLMQALTTGIPLQEPVHITKALRAQREVRVSLAGGTGPGAAAFLVNIQMTPWANTKETAEAFAYGYNRALKEYRAALLDVAAQLDGGQEGSESNG